MAIAMVLGQLTVACNSSPSGSSQSGSAPSAPMNQQSQRQSLPTLLPVPASLPLAGGVIQPKDTSQPSKAPEEASREAYNRIEENPFQRVSNNPLSTFSIDVDAGSYSNVRRFINEGKLPPKDAVRLEELINYFTYEYPEPKAIATRAETEIAPV